MWLSASQRRREGQHSGCQGVSPTSLSDSTTSAFGRFRSRTSSPSGREPGGQTENAECCPNPPVTPSRSLEVPFLPFSRF